MNVICLPPYLENLLVVGPFYNKLEKLAEIVKWLPEYDCIIFNDGIAYTYDNIESIIYRTKVMDQLLETKKVIYNKGNIDCKIFNQLDWSNPQHLYLEHWLKDKPNLVSINLNDSYQLLITSGGIPPEIYSINKLYEKAVQASFTEHPHETYSGGLGYVISNQPYTKWAPKYYRYSVQMGNTIEGQVYALKVNKNGIHRTIIV